MKRMEIMLKRRWKKKRRREKNHDLENIIPTTTN